MGPSSGSSLIEYRCVYEMIPPSFSALVGRDCVLLILGLLCANPFEYSTSGTRKREKESKRESYFFNRYHFQATRQWFIVVHSEASSVRESSLGTFLSRTSNVGLRRCCFSACREIDRQGARAAFPKAPGFFTGRASNSYIAYFPRDDCWRIAHVSVSWP